MPVDGVMVMVREKYGVKLAPEERERLEGLVRSGKSPAGLWPGLGSSSRPARDGRLLRWPRRWTSPKARCSVSSGDSPRRGWRGCCGTGPSPPGPGSWMRGAKPTSSPWPAARPQRDMITGPCACWQARWWNWGWPRRCPMRESASGSKKRSQAVAEDGVVHPEGERGFRGQHGGRAGPVRGTP